MTSLDQTFLPRLNEHLVENGLLDHCVNTFADFDSLDDLSSEDFSKALANVFDCEFKNTFDEFHFDPTYPAKIPIGLSRHSGMVLLQKRNQQNVLEYFLVVSGIAGVNQLDNIRRIFRSSPSLIFSLDDSVQSLINRVYENRETKTNQIIDSIQLDAPNGQAIVVDDDLLDTESRAPIIGLVNSTLFDAVNQRASDVHFQPYEDRLVIRFRIDGVLFDVFDVPKQSQEEVLSRIKILGKMNIAEKRLPQDGRTTVRVGDRRIDLRLASIPTSFGERIVIRLLDKSARLYSLSEIGMGTEILNDFKNLIHREHGMILVTGPTGAGKSTTLYAALQEINTKDKNVVTLEDPIEYQLPGVSQTQVSEKKGMTFAKGLRNVLRQDPDIIMVGEIRDQETAEMAIQSALTGHLVFSTLHTNDAPSSITRLYDLGIEPYLVASSVAGVLAQRLVRRLCPNCKTQVTGKSLKVLQSDRDWSAIADTIFVGKGCEQCRDTGYVGRVGIYEQMTIDEVLAGAIQSNCNSGILRTLAKKQNSLSSLLDDGIKKVAHGMTSVDEIQRIRS